MKTIHRWALLFVVVGGTLQAAPLAPQSIGLTPTTPIIIDVPKGGPNPAQSKTLTVTNTGSGQLNWAVSAIAYTPSNVPPWLQLSKSSGKLGPGLSFDIQVNVDVGTIDSGTYTAKITVIDSGDNTVTPKEATVEMRVSAVGRIEASPTAFTFAAPQGSTPPDQDLTVKNTGGATLDWSFVVDQSWVQLSPAPEDLGPGASQVVKVSVNPSSLGTGPHTAKITLSAPGAANVEINVTFTINANPAIGLSPTSLTFDAPQGGPNPVSKEFTVKNDGGGTLSWSATDDAAWLSLNPAGGSLASGQSQVVTVTVDVLTPANPANLVEGTYLATITVAGTNAATGLAVANSPRTLGVTLHVNSIPTIGLNPQNLSFKLATDSGESAPAGVSITNTGSGTLTWSVSGGDPWVSASPGGGSLNTLSSQPLQVTVVPFGLAPGVYTTSLQISAPGASNSPRILSVEMTVTPASLPTSAPAGQCGLLGLELIGVALLIRFLKSRGGPSCISR
jgi:hypothetical protein